MTSRVRTLPFVVSGHTFAGVSRPKAGAVWIRCSSVAHRGRPGLNGEPFTIYKFRTTEDLALGLPLPGVDVGPRGEPGIAGPPIDEEAQ